VGVTRHVERVSDKATEGMHDLGVVVARAGVQPSEPDKPVNCPRLKLEKEAHLSLAARLAQPPHPQNAGRQGLAGRLHGLPFGCPVRSPASRTFEIYTIASQNSSLDQQLFLNAFFKIRSPHEGIAG